MPLHTYRILPLPTVIVSVVFSAPLPLSLSLDPAVGGALVGSFINKVRDQAQRGSNQSTEK